MTDFNIFNSGVKFKKSLILLGLNTVASFIATGFFGWYAAPISVSQGDCFNLTKKYFVQQFRFHIFPHSKF